ncbi:hypothetical protein PULV_a3894 [Pseudoalteromonas ulvae UL12]|uniref:hypothetical protein n=1 Tax=Pseudoalteromonas ulvae TaxID=107327 RepID=UPI00186B598B|nr:hypothetical protein [Pseudoalteromonas ulvae]MBE0362099.1 hypothetical protein [Pseudoalteromonas ulvae UL12]
MMKQHSQSNEVEALLSSLSKHRSIIARGYAAKREAEFYSEEEPVIQLLRTQGFVRPVGEGQFRLSKQLRDLINRGVNRQHIRDINVNLGQFTDSLDLAVEDYLSAQNRKDRDDIESACDELVSIFYEMGDFFSDASEEIDQQVKLVIGNHAYGAERIRIIRAYLEKLDRLQEAYETLSQSLTDEIYTEDSFLCDERIKFISRTLKYIDNVKSTHKEIKAVLHMREVREQRTQRLRQLDAYLRENPAAEFNKAASLASDCLLFRNAQKIDVQSFIDVDSHDQKWISFYERQVATSMLKKPAVVDKYERPSTDSMAASPVSRKRESSIALDMIGEMVKCILRDKQSLSVTRYWQFHPNRNEVSFSYWLYISRTHLTRLIKSPKGLLAKYVNVKPIYATESQSCGNRTVADVVVAYSHLVDHDKAGSGRGGSSEVL